MFIPSLYWKSFLVWMLIALAEVIHGALRAKFIAPRVGDLRSRQLAVFSGSFLIFLISVASISWIHPTNSQETVFIGIIWLIYMLIFEFSVGRYLFGFPWKWLINDLNPFKGRLLLFGMIFLAFAPFIAAKIQELI